jgi:sugar phosphate isomerase/epimerase
MSNEKNFKIYAFADEADSFIDGQIAAMKRNGLQGLEIRNVDGTNVSDITLDKAKEVRKKLEDNGLITWSIGSPIGKIGIEDDNFEQHIEKFKHTIEIAHELGAENIRLFSFFVPRDKDPAIFKDKVLSRMGRFVDVAEGSNIYLCHENEKGIYGENAARCLEIHKAFPTLKGIFDPANFVQSGQDTLEAWDMLHTYVKYMHIKDALLDGSVVPAGKGMGNVEAILAAYHKQGGYAMTIEPHLAVFKGLSDLEREGEQSKVGEFVYADNDAAFDAACDALKKILP